MPYLPEIKYAIRKQEDYYNHCLHLRDHGYGHSQTSSHSSHLQMDMMLYMSLPITLQRWLTSFLASPTVPQNNWRSSTFNMCGCYMGFLYITTQIVVVNSRLHTCGTYTRIWVSTSDFPQHTTQSHRDRSNQITNGLRLTCESSLHIARTIGHNIYTLLSLPTTTIIIPALA